MNILAELRRRFADALTDQVDGPVDALVEMIKPSQDARFGDYQANCAMPLGKRLGKSPRDVAQQIVDALEVDDLCEPPEIAGPGFINLKIRDKWLVDQLRRVVSDSRLGVVTIAQPKTYVLDYSAPNVAKPMHVGHIRSTVIGDALAHTLRFLGHRVITDNHIGDWGTQFGMILYGYKHFLDPAAYEASEVTELARLYRLVSQLVDYQKGRRNLSLTEARAAELADAAATAQQATPTGDAKADKKTAKALRRLESQARDARDDVQQLVERLAAVENDAVLGPLALAHPDIDQRVLAETAALHTNDATNVALWRQFLPACMEDINRIYGRLGVSFDHTLGESFYHERLGPVVHDLREREIAIESDGAICVFREGEPVPMIVQKKDGAYLYATTDLATIAYRKETWQPDAILYVVDHRQSLHFEQLFAAAASWDYGDIEFQHIRFGTVLGDDGRPFKTRSGTSVGLEGLLDEAIRRAHVVVSDNDEAKPSPELSEEERARVAEVVGIAALKYADLCQNRESDYVFSYDKMLALTGNTAAYMQYAYARIRAIFTKGNVDHDAIRSDGDALCLEQPAERALGLALLRFAEAIDTTVADYRPNHITNYLFETAEKFSSFYNACPVLKAETDATRASRLLLCDLTGRTMKRGLALLGIEVVEKM